MKIALSVFIIHLCSSTWAQTHAVPKTMVVIPSEQQINQEALKQAQQVLTNPQLRQEALNTDAAQKANQVVNVTSLGDQNIASQIFSVTSDLLPWLAEMGQGDSQEMMRLLQSAQSSPEGMQQFFQRMPAAQREKIQQIAQKIESLRRAGKKNP